MMTRHFFAAGLRVALFAATALSAPAALAQTVDLDDFTARLKAAAAATDTKLDYSDARIEGTSVFLTDVTVAPAQDETDPLTFDQMIFDQVERASNGDYRVGEVTVPDIDISEEDMRISVEDMSVSGLVLPEDVGQGETTLDNMVFYEQARLGPVTVTQGETDVFTLDELVVDVSKRDGNSGIDTMARAEEISIDLSTIRDPKTQDALEAMGYERLNGSMKMAAGWEAETGELDLSDYSLSFDDVGTLAISTNLSGYTLELIDSIQETAARAESAETDEALGLAVMGLLQQMTFNSARITFQDDGLTHKLLDYIGGRQNISGDKMAQAVKGMMPLFLGQLNNPEFQDQAQDAVNAFMDDPQSLTINAEPEEAVPFAAIMGAGMTGPERIIDLLGIEIFANK